MNDLLQLPEIKTEKQKVKIDKLVAYTIAGNIAAIISNKAVNQYLQDVYTDLYNELVKRINRAGEKQTITVKLRYFQLHELLHLFPVIQDTDPYVMTKKQEAYEVIHKLLN